MGEFEGFAKRINFRFDDFNIASISIVQMRFSFSAQMHQKLMSPFSPPYIFHLDVNDQMSEHFIFDHFTKTEIDIVRKLSSGGRPFFGARQSIATKLWK